MTPMLIVFGGLPGTGKSSIARALAREAHATYLRIDVIERAIHVSRGTDDALGPEGYIIAYALAESNLELGQIVVADSVNPIPLTRDAWRGVAARKSVPLLEIELVCTDATEHRRRVETRTAEIPGASLPTWAAVVARDYAAWPEPHLVLDTARTSIEEAVAIIVAAMAEKTNR